MRFLVVSDVKGRLDLLRALLQHQGVIDAEGARIRDPEVSTVQLGDLIAGKVATRAADLATLRKANAWFDVHLVGDVEYGYMGGVPFSGFQAIREVEGCLKNLFLLPAVSIGGTLLTHAGLAKVAAVPGDTAKEVADALTQTWALDRGHPWFASVGKLRGGRLEAGGVIWSDFREERDRRVSQVHGHTSVEAAPVVFGDWEAQFVADIYDADDLRLVGLWLDDEGRPVEAVHVEDDRPVAA